MLIFVPLDHTQIGECFSIYDTVTDNFVAVYGNHTWETFEDYRSDAENEAALGHITRYRVGKLLAKEKEIIRWFARRA